MRVWEQHPDDFFDESFLDADGTLAPSDSWCKQGVDIAYNGTWDYHPLVVSLANTSEPLYLVNRSGNRPSHEQAEVYLDKAIALCRRAYCGPRAAHRSGGRPADSRGRKETLGLLK